MTNLPGLLRVAKSGEQWLRVSAADVARTAQRSGLLLAKLPQVMIDVPEGPDHPLLPGHLTEHRVRHV